MKLLCYIEKILSNASEIKNIGETKIENGYLDEINLKKLIKCWKDNIIYEIYFEELLDYIDIKSFSNAIIDVMIKENVGIEKISHMPLKDEILSKLACVNQDAYMLYIRKLYTNSEYSEKELLEYFAHNYNDSGYEYLCILNGSNYDKEIIIDYIANKISRKESVRALVHKRVKARTLRYETNNEILLSCIKENEYIYDLEIAQNIFASEQILRELMKLKGLKYCKEIKRRAEETLQKKMMICVMD